MTAPHPAKHLRGLMDEASHEYYRRLAVGQVATTRCPGCQVTAFPPRSRCPRCGGEQEWVELPRRGRVHAFTTQETALRFTAPTVIALVELGEAVVPGVLETPYEQLRIGQEVEAATFQEPSTGLTLLRFAPA